MRAIFQSHPYLLLSSLCLLSACAFPAPVEAPAGESRPPEITHTPKPDYWIPSPSDRFQIQLSDYPPTLDVDVDVIEIDLFETPKSAIQYLRQSGMKVICYFNAGAWEEYRPDAGKFPPQVIGNQYIGWKGERWLDIRNFEVFSDLIAARLDLAVEKGCDAVDPDNIDGFQHDTGFHLTPQDQIRYNVWLSDQAHQRKLSIGMKNNPTQVVELADHFDFAVIEDCAEFKECAAFLPFAQQGKAVFQIEYTDVSNDFKRICLESQQNGFSPVLKHRVLDAWFESCNS